MRPHFTWHRGPHIAGLYADGRHFATFIGGSISAWNDATITAQLDALNPPSWIPRPWLFITTSLPVGVELLPEKRVDFLRFQLDRMGLPSDAVPWLGWEHAETAALHYHVVSLPMTFAGRWIELGPMKPLAERLDCELSDWMGLPKPYYFQPRLGPGLAVQIPKRRVETEPQRALANALMQVFQHDQPESLAALKLALARQGEGFIADVTMNRHGAISYEFSSPAVLPILGGQLSPELEPRFIDARFSRARAMRELRARIELSILVRAFEGADLSIQLTLLREIQDGRDDLSRPQPRQLDAGAPQTRRDAEGGQGNAGDGLDDPQLDPRPVAEAGRWRARSGEDFGPNHQRAGRDDRRDARYVEATRGPDSGTATGPVENAPEFDAVDGADRSAVGRPARHPRRARRGSLGELIAWVRCAAREAQVRFRLARRAHHIRLQFEKGASIDVDHHEVRLLGAGQGDGQGLMRFVARLVVHAGMKAESIPAGVPLRPGRLLAVTRARWEALDAARRLGVDGKTTGDRETADRDPGNEPEL